MDEQARDRLFRAMEANYRALQPFRSLTHSLVEEMAGSSYGQAKGDKREQLLPLMAQAVEAYCMALVANRPRVILSTKRQDLLPFAKHFETAVNNLISEVGVEFTLRRWVMDAWLGLGIIKIHLADSGQVALEGDLWMDPGTPFASNVSLDNFVFDMTATKFTEVKFAADSYRIPFADLKGPMYDQEAIAELTPTTKYQTDDAERLERISRGYEVDQDEYEPMIDLIDVFIPRENKIYTFALDGRGRMRPKGPPLAVMDWDGPEFGPYHILSFNDVPENIMPSSPAAQLASLSRLVNNLMRKQSKRARNSKNLNVFRAGAEEDAERVKNAGDGEFIRVDEPESVQAVSVPGVDANLQQFLLNTIDMFDRMAGNLNAMAGLGATADTVGQEKLIHGAASKKEAAMQYRVVDGAVRVIRDLGHMLWHDKMKVLQGQIDIEGTDISVDSTWTPEHREGNFFDYNFEIDLYSMPYQSPAQKAQAITQILTTVYAPFQQMLASQGGTIDMQSLNDIYAELLNEPRLRSIIKFAPPMEQGMEEMPGPANTTREYVRRNQGAAPNAQSKSHQQQAQWAAAAQQQGQPR